MRIDGTRHDPCVRDVFAAAVDFARGGPARPWWTFTPERKARDRPDANGPGKPDVSTAKRGSGR